VRVFQQFAHVDLISGGRAEIMAGRGSLIESFPLFGPDLNDNDELFTEKLELLLAISRPQPVSWHGAHRAAARQRDGLVASRPGASKRFRNASRARRQTSSSRDNT
jgi:alkanesulfonate monooxygenase SsuD/methylene tetrahydromethanopterin reductase-like flavin-dependent oxidoreductase (luciferase family)